MRGNSGEGCWLERLKLLRGLERERERQLGVRMEGEI
jgi:hypothetical protein